MKLTDPNTLPSEIETADRSAAIEKPNVFAIGDRSEDRCVAEDATHFHGIAPRQIDLPENFAGIGI